METRGYQSYTVRTMADGTVKKYPVTKYYQAPITHKQITGDIQTKILELHGLGVPATKIAREVGISVERVRRVIKKQ